MASYNIRTDFFAGQYVRSAVRHSRQISSQLMNVQLIKLEHQQFLERITLAEIQQVVLRLCRIRFRVDMLGREKWNALVAAQLAKLKHQHYLKAVAPTETSYWMKSANQRWHNCSIVSSLKKRCRTDDDDYKYKTKHGRIFVASTKEESVTTKKKRLRILVDSGATHHITGQPDLLHNINTNDTPCLFAANGSTLDAEGSGELRTEQGFVLQDVVYVPETDYTILSVSKLTKLGWTVTFGATSSISNDKVTYQLKEEGPGIFFLYVNPILSKGNILTKSAANMVHRRFCLESRGMLPLVYDGTIGARDGIEEKKSSVLGKHKRSPVTKAPSRPCVRSNMISIGLRGPISGKFSFKYFLNVLHLKSNYMTEFPMRSKQEVLRAMEQYCVKHKDFKFVRANAHEVFLSKEFKNLMAKHGKRLRFSKHKRGVHGSQKLARRAVDRIICSLVIQSKLPLEQYYPFENATAVLLHNRRPAANGVSPYQLRYGRKPDVSFIRTFGCRVLITKQTPCPKNKRKATPGILLGFTEGKSGFGTYQVLNLQTNKIIYTRDLTFFETLNVKDKLPTTNKFQLNIPVAECNDENDNRYTNLQILATAARAELGIKKEVGDEITPEPVVEQVEDECFEVNNEGIETKEHSDDETEVNPPSKRRRSTRIVESAYNNDFAAEQRRMDDQIGTNPNEATHLSHKAGNIAKQ